MSPSGICRREQQNPLIEALDVGNWSNPEKEHQTFTALHVTKDYKHSNTNKKPTMRPRGTSNYIWPKAEPLHLIDRANAKAKTYSRRDSQMVTYFSIVARINAHLCMAERKCTMERVEALPTSIAGQVDQSAY
jgi:hypothetical protein